MTPLEIETFGRLEQSAVIAVLIIEREDDAVPVAQALMAGGITAMELTLRTPAAIGALKKIRHEVPDMLAGIGTILTTDQVKEVVDCGAAFGVAPGTNPRIIEAAMAAGLPFAPGVCTPSDIERALEYDRKFLKFFPAEPSGGLKYLESIAAPYQHLGVKYVPLGGLNAGNCGSWLAHKLIGGVGGSWLAPKKVIDAKEWTLIAQAAAQCVAIRKHIRGH